MSLNWNLENIKNYKEVCWIPDPTPDKPDAVRLNPVTEVLIWKTMMADIGKLTDRNIDEFAYRVLLWDKLFGGSLVKRNTDTGETEECSPTYAEIVAHVGLHTNVFPETKRSAWNKKIGQAIDSEFGYVIREQIKKAKAEMSKPELHVV